MDPLVDIFRAFAQPTPGQEKPSEWSLIQVLQDAEKSNSIVVVSQAPAGPSILVDRPVTRPCLSRGG